MQKCKQDLNEEKSSHFIHIFLQCFFSTAGCIDGESAKVVYCSRIGVIQNMKWLLASALLPAVLLMRLIYRSDTVEREPWGLLWRLALRGALSCLPAALLEGILGGYLNSLVPPGTMLNSFLETFLVIAMAEEGCKYLMLRKTTWNDPNFNYRFDGIVYGVFVSLGFAALENVIYVFEYGPGVILSRGLFSIPGHCTFGIFMGLFYANSKQADIYNSGLGHRRNQWLAFWVPVLLHGFYDFCLMSGSTLLTIAFWGFVVVTDVLAIRVVRWQSRNDRGL